MDTETKACCARAAGWGMVGIAIALGWGLGNLNSGMSVLSAFAIPALIMLLVVGVVVLATLNVPWFNRLCTCENDSKRGDHKEHEGVSGMSH